MESRKRAPDAGFTLIELMVVVAILAVLIAIAAPMFSSSVDRAEDRTAQHDVRMGLLAEKVYFTNFRVFTSTPADLLAIDGSLIITGDPDTGLAIVVNGSANAVCISMRSESGTYFGLHEHADDGTMLGSGTADPFGGSCPDAAPAGFAQRWYPNP